MSRLLRDGTERDPHDGRVPRRAAGLLAAMAQAGVLESADVHVGVRLGALADEPDERVHLATALAVRAVRHGSVLVHLADVAATLPVDGLDPDARAALPWPETAGWVAAVAASPLTSVGADAPEPGRPLRLVDGSLYLDRYWTQEQVVGRALDERAGRTPPVADPAVVAGSLHELFASRPDASPGHETPGEGPDLQRLACAIAAHRWTTVLAGGPGTGKTTTVARLVALLADVAVGAGERVPRVAFAAPTGKAAARLQEAVLAEVATLGGRHAERLGGMSASTIHRLLGWRPGVRGRFRHDAGNRLPYDVVVVDEASMVSLTLMARLVEALRADTRLVLVGDPEQLASVEAGAVLGDLVDRAAPADVVSAEAAVAASAGGDLDSLDPEARHAAVTAGTVRLVRSHRFGGAIADLAGAIRDARADDVVDLLAAGAGDLGTGLVELVDPGEVDVVPESVLARVRPVAVGHAVDVTGAARAGDPVEAVRRLEQHRLLCAHRSGPFGVSWWSRLVEQWVAATPGGPVVDGTWYVGRPLLVSENDRTLDLWNGDTGVVVDGHHDGRAMRVAVFGGRTEPLVVPVNRLGAVQTVHAMTVHRSQGSQFDHVTLVLPPPDSPLLTRELFYTAVTRAKTRVTVVGTPEAVRTAVDRPIVRATGLRTRP